MSTTKDGRISLTIDGQEIDVPPTKTAYDPQFKKNVEIPTTIYDAASALAEKNGKPNPISVLCHREHVNPVAVCRLCVVEAGGPRLTAACHRQVEQGMVVKTAETSERVKGSIKVLTELLLADQPPGVEKKSGSEENELFAIASRYGVQGSRFPKRRNDRGQDDSSLIIAVDHNACILCDRCIRGCNEIRDNQVLGRAGKGYGAHIAFDLNTPMGDSSCVACGECMISCPTGALTFRNPVQAEPWKNAVPKPEPVSAESLAKHPLFQGVSLPFLEWNEKSVVRRHFKKGDIICREGEFGSTAFYIDKGKVEIFIKAPIKHVKSRHDDESGGKSGWGLFGLARRVSSRLVGRGAEHRDEESTSGYIHIDAPVSLQYDNPTAILNAGEIFGEMTCMSHYPRSATVRAAEDCVILELLRNVLYILQRSRHSRGILEKNYRERAVDGHLRSVRIFSGLGKNEAEFKRFIDYMRSRVELIRCPPGEIIFRQGDPADDFYLVRIGFVKVAQQRQGGEHVLTYIGPGGYFGEIGLLSHIPEVRQALGDIPHGVRTATCSGLDHVDLVRIKGEDFRKIVEDFPQVRDELVRVAVDNLKANAEAARQVAKVPLGDFLKQGLMNAQSLLVLDLERCTRCDECTKACADAHDGVTRLIREGLRFDKYLVASSCRSCLDPYCMVGCPVGSIRRRDSREIIIEDWCIGCGKCAENCPYGNINMHPFPTGETAPDARTGRQMPVVQQKATLCDLCTGLDGQPSCVYACPHDAAHRMTGQQLLQLVERASS
ncbi:MAG: cyclic nucleotide-binding domain-containing protein [Gemmataceae bacterium]|nr:cyclic nucleotide-binding domain-containing protein [Gemmataceae bacterium]